ncbi:MAG: FadR/GntR family transcriptional regulator [bacterium]
MGPQIRPVERQRLYESIVDQMHQLIMDGTWQPGEQLPSERELVEMLSVGRASVREALRILEALGYIAIRPGDGSYVSKNVNINSRLHKLSHLIRGEEYITDLMEVRELIESQIAFIAAESASAQDIASLEAILDKQASAIDAGEDGVEQNIEFHVRLTQATGNQVLLELQQIFFQLSHKAITEFFRVPGRRHESLRQHRAIIEALYEHDSQRAHHLMLQHLRSRYRLPNHSE